MEEEKKTKELQELERIGNLLETLTKIQLADVIEKELSDPKKQKLYELTDGKTGVETIKQKTGFSAGKISGIWQNWAKKGLIKKEGRLYKKMFR